MFMVTVKKLKALNWWSLNVYKEVQGRYTTGNGDPVVAFVHYRFIGNREIPVVYVNKLQLGQCMRGRGFGKFRCRLLSLLYKKTI